MSQLSSLLAGRSVCVVHRWLWHRVTIPCESLVQTNTWKADVASVAWHIYYFLCNTAFPVSLILFKWHLDLKFASLDSSFHSFFHLL